MLNYTIYKALKSHLNAISPCFLFIGQYNKGKDNTSYIVPAIYIETPKDNKVDVYPNKIAVTKGVQFKIHIITHAPFKNMDTSTQDLQLEEHEAKIKLIDKTLNGLVLKDLAGNLLSQQFITINISEMNFMDLMVVTVLTYRTDIYSRHLR